jgi:hypothetical protein
MGKILSTLSESMLDRKDIRRQYKVTIAGVNVTSSVLSYSFSNNIDFGISSCDIELINSKGEFSSEGLQEISLGDAVIFTEEFANTSDSFTNFSGYVRQRRITKSSGGTNIITLTCLDYLVKLEDTEVEHRFEAVKLSTNEILTPNYLGTTGEKNDHLAQVFDFSNISLALDPPPSISIYDRDSAISYPQEEGVYQINHETGQLVLGSALNAYDSYDVKASYSYYPKGLYVEDIIEDLIVEKDGYGNYLFNETSEANIIANHLTETFYNMEGTNTDTMVPNYSSQTIIISTTLTVAVVAGATSITVASTEGFLASGTGNINGESFTWTAKPNATTLTCSAITSAHAIGSYVNYKATYAAGQVWYTSYSHITTTLTSADYTLPVGITINYVDLRSGRIILNQAISTLYVVTCNTNYSFNTLQSTGIETPVIDFTFQKTKNRLDALKTLRDLLPPNYILRTIGTEKIWGTYLSQKVKEDYTLKCIASLDYAEDTDIYSRTKFFGENDNPTNVCWQPGLAFLSTGETYTATANNTTLDWDRTEGEWQVFSTGLPPSSIITSTFQPRVRINGVQINDQLQQIIMQPVTVEHWSIGEVGGRLKYRTRVHFSWTGLDPAHDILLYDSTGVAAVAYGGVITAGNSYMNYEAGIMESGPMDDNDPWSRILEISTASFWVHWSRQYLQIDFGKAEIKIHSKLIPVSQINQVKVTADFEYKSIIEGIRNGEYIIDGRWDSQAQTVFYQKPASGFVYFRVDLGTIYAVQAIDLVAGFYKPDAESSDEPLSSRRKFDTNNIYTLKYSTDNITYYNVCKEAIRFRLSGGESITFERDQIGDSFQARYFQLEINDMTEIPYGKGVYVAAFTEFCVYKDLVLIGEAKLVPYAELAVASTLGATSITVDDTTGFSSSGTAYIVDDAFTYTSKTATAFLGCASVTAHALDSRVSQELGAIGGYTNLSVATTAGDVTVNVNDTTDFTDKGTAYIAEDTFTYTGKTSTTFIGCVGVDAHSYNEKVVQKPTCYDVEGLLGRLGDKVYKDMDINPYLSTQERVNRRSRDWLKEFQKDHSKLSATVPFSPHLRVSHTLLIQDATNRINQRYFIESLTNNSGTLNLILARYP